MEHNYHCHSPNTTGSLDSKGVPLAGCLRATRTSGDLILSRVVRAGQTYPVRHPGARSFEGQGCQESDKKPENMCCLFLFCLLSGEMYVDWLTELVLLQ